MLTLEQLRIFKEAAERESFSAAAKALGKAVSTVSSAIGILEDHLGVTLFDRSGYKPVLTDDGQRVYTDTLLLLRQLGALERNAMQALQDVESQVRIGIDELLPTSIFESVLGKASAAFPNTRFSLQRGQPLGLSRQLLQQELDMVLQISTGRADNRLVPYFLQEMPTVMVCSPDHQLASMAIVGVRELYHTRQIICTAMTTNPMLESGTYSPEVYDASSLNDVIAMVEMGLGWTALPEPLARAGEEAGTLVRFHSDLAPIDAKIAVELLVRVDQEGAGPVQLFLLDQFVPERAS